MLNTTGKKKKAVFSLEFNFNGSGKILRDLALFAVHPYALLAARRIGNQTITFPLLVPSNPRYLR